jgi:hypothetical protein
MGLDSLADFATEALDVASEILDDGLEFLSDGFDQLTEAVTDFAGDSEWFNANSFGDIFGGPEALGDLGGAGFGGGFFDSISDFATDLKISVLGPELVAGPGAGQSFFGQLVDRATDLLPSVDSLVDKAQKSAVDAVTGQVKSAVAGAVNTAISSVASGAVRAGVPASLVNNAAGTVSATTTGLIYGRTTSLPSASSILDSTVTFVTGSATATAQTVAQSAVNTLNSTVVAGSNLVNSAVSTATAPALAATRTLASTVTVTNVNGQPLTVQAPLSATQIDRSAQNVGYITAFDPETQTYAVVNESTGVPVTTGLTEQQALLQAQEQTFIDAGEVPEAPTNTNIKLNAGPGVAGTIAYDDEGNLLPGYTLDEDNNPVFVGGNFVEPATAALAEAARTSALQAQARQQQTIRDQRQNKAQSGDWRVRLRLAPNSNYLYNDPDCGPVLWPLNITDGVIFPYTPAIDIGYKANYSPYDLTHSNYRGYFYQNSAIDQVNVRATFTAQDTQEANYLLAVIHFFRSATKMFYGQDAQRGAPPPLCYLSGFGDYQFSEHPVVISQFNYNLPADVNYIRAQTATDVGTNLQPTTRNRQSIAGNPLSYALQRLQTLGQGINKGALDSPFAPSGSLGVGTPTYVPTKMDITLTLLPMQSRQQASKQFSLKGFANGNLLKGGFW